MKNTWVTAYGVANLGGEMSAIESLPQALTTDSSPLRQFSLHSLPLKSRGLMDAISRRFVVASKLPCFHVNR